MAAIDPGDGSWVELSDASTKEDLHLYKPVLQDITKLNVSTYHYKSNKHGLRSLGLVAQNVAQYFPELVGKMLGKNGDQLLGVRYGKTGVLALKAIQEQQEIIETLQNKIEQLEKKLVAFEKLLQQKF